jgi:ATP-dependent phosphoenolpyruvate carboxykinase
MPNVFTSGEEKEPDIYHAIRPGALVENVKFFPGTDRINFDDGSITENTRVSYPLSFIVMPWSRRSAASRPIFSFSPAMPMGYCPPFPG